MYLSTEGHMEIMYTKIFELIENLRADRRIVSYGEAETKQAIVLRLLSILGWDTFNIDEVTPEYSVKLNRVDFSLRHNNTNKVFIEVKKPNEELENHQEQLLKYSFQEGVKLSILTNGVSWWFYLPLNEGSWDQRKFYTIDVFQQDPELISKKFIELLSKINILSGQAIINAENIYNSQKKRNIIKETIPKAWNKLITDRDEMLLDFLSETTERLCGYRADSDLIENFLIKNRDNLLVYQISKVKTQTPVITQINKSTALPDDEFTGKSIDSFNFLNKTYKVKYWKDVLVVISGVLAADHKKEFEKVFGLVGRKRIYFSHNSNELREPKKVPGTDVYVETHMSAKMLMKMCKDVLALFNYTENELKVFYK